MFFCIKRDCDSSTFRRSHITRKKERLTIQFSKTSPVEVSGKLAVESILNDVGAALVITDEDGIPDHEQTEQFCLEVAQGKLEAADDTNVAAWLTPAQKDAHDNELKRVECEDIESEKAKAEKQAKADEEAAEKAELERIAAEKQSAEEAEAEKKVQAEKEAAEKKAAEEKANAEKEANKQANSK